MTKTNSYLGVLLVPTAILMIPLGAMVFKVKGWAWGPGDFIAAWILMAGTGLAYKLVTRKAISLAYRFATGLAVATAFILIWINGAVGIIGSEENPANAMYAGVLVIGLIGAIIARFRAEGMARTLLAMASAQLLVPVIALIRWKYDFAPGILPVFGLNAVFTLLFVGSALLFQRAARQASAANVATTA